MTVDLVPDVEQIVSRYLQGESDLTAMFPVANVHKVVTEIPREPTFPLVVLRRIGGGPTTSRPLYHDRALLQVDVYGGNKKLANTIIETVRALLARDSFARVHEYDGDPIGVVTGVEFGALRWLPDSSYDPAKPRYVLDVAVHTHRVLTVGS